MKDSLNIIFGPQGLILIGGIITLIGALWSAKVDLKSEKELNKKNEIIIQKTETISELNSKIVNVLTGGDSFPYVILASLDQKKGIPSLFLNGDNAIANVSGRFIDIRELRREQRKGNFNYNSGMNFNKNIISPAYLQFLVNEKTYFDITKSSRYMIHFYTPYNTFTQYLAIEPSTKDGHPLQAYKIFKGNDKQLIKTNCPENFPIPLDDIDFAEEIPTKELEQIKSKK